MYFSSELALIKPVRTSHMKIVVILFNLVSSVWFPYIIVNYLFYSNYIHFLLSIKLQFYLNSRPLHILHIHIKTVFVGWQGPFNWRQRAVCYTNMSCLLSFESYTQIWVNIVCINYNTIKYMDKSGLYVLTIYITWESRRVIIIFTIHSRHQRFVK